ncbi:Efflux transport system, outer membrane factor (OMF) lipoprotein [Olavius algarvensis associated proteobacterium Delta 3]|nr:Efflux transport system, outer membrane factor (OMF) lipoprotein [Olavius algarvensis associated proteobacterium Delta 3]
MGSFHWGWKSVFLLFPVWLLCACTTVGPDFVKPKAAVEKEWSEKDDPSVRTDALDYSEWWKVFDDPILNRLIQIASTQNLSLQIAGLRILEARALLGIAIGLQYPQSQALSGGITYLKSSENAPPLSNLPTDVRNRLDTSTNNYQIGFDAAWELDFWGKFRRGVESADANLAASIANYDNLLVILNGEVASAYVIIRTLEQRLVYIRSNTEIQQKGLELAEVRFEAGATSELDVQQARSLLRNTEALIPALEISLRQAQNGLSVLLGRPPGDLQDILGDPSPIPTAPAQVAVGVPAELMRRRPDIQLAEFRAASQGARIGVAEADLYPHFALAGSIGWSAGDGSTLFSVDSLTGFFTPLGFRWDIFNYGRIRNNVRIQDARFEQLVVNYRNTVLLAAREVEDGLVGFLRSRQQADLLSDAADASKRAAELALIQYDEGWVDYTRVLNTQQSLLNQQDALAVSHGDIVRFLVAVYKALGGGWQVRIGADILPAEMLEAMKKRTNWGNLMQPVSLPADISPPPTGRDVNLFHNPKW